MDNNQKAFVSLFSAAVQKNAITLPPSRLEKLYELARIHGAVPILYSALQLTGYHENIELLSSMRKETMLACSKQAIMYHIFHIFLTKCEEKGIFICVLKGPVIAALYPSAEMRITSDIDILIHKNDLARIILLLKECGAETDKENSTEDCVHAMLEKILHLEVHTSLFHPSSIMHGFIAENLLKEGAYQKTEACGMTFFAPVPTLHLEYLLCHMADHFTGTGFGLRQIADCALFITHNNKDINWNAFYESMRSYSLTTFTCAVFNICIRYFGADKKLCPNFSAFNSQADALLEDIVSGGIFGRASAERSASFSLTRRAASNGTPSILRTLFPPAKSLTSKYPYAKKNILLLPAAWANRITDFFSSKNKESAGMLSQISHTIKIYQNRTDLIRLLEIDTANAAIKNVSLDSISPLIDAAFQEGKTVYLPISGHSMSPFLKNGRDSVILEKIHFPVKKGDVILYRRSSGQIVLHRVLFKKNEKYAMCGDAQGFLEKNISGDQFIARAAAFMIDNRAYSLKSMRSIFFSAIWRWLYPVRWGISKIRMNKK